MKSLNNSLGIYIHIPFCRKKCGYCDFLSYESGDIEEYFSALKREIVFMGEFLSHRNVDTVFIGGGTPSIADAKEITDTLSLLRDCFGVEDNAEISIEINPDSLDERKLSEYVKSGINRFSLGVQSFDDEKLKLIGRVHDSSEAKSAIKLLSSRADNYNIDMMMALPNQSMEDLKKDLEILLSFYPKHISYYSLILEEGTLISEFAKKNPEAFPSEETDREMYHYICNSLKREGFLQYEISNFERESFHCRHNLKYWELGEYLGLGAGASSYFNHIRKKNTSSLKEYIAFSNSPSVVGEFQSEKDEMEDFAIFGLRKTEGISKKAFKEKFSEDFDEVYNLARKKLIRQGLAEEDKTFFRETALGRDLSNKCEIEFLF